MPPPAQLAQQLLHAAGSLFHRPEAFPVLIAAAVGALTRWWRQWRRGAKARKARHWPSCPAVIEIVSFKTRQNSEKKQVSVAVLTYFYRLPELQSGDCEREFLNLDAARKWAEQFKGRTVMVHVNPANAADSVLLDADLEGVTNYAASTVEEAVGKQGMPELPHSSLLLCSLGELASLAGLALTAVLLAVRIIHGNAAKHPLGQEGTTWIVLVLLAMAAIAAWLVANRRVEGGATVWKASRQWYPAWARWLVQGSGGLIGIPWLWGAIRDGMWRSVGPWFQHLTPYLPYLVVCWCFLALSAFHGAVLRSQEETHTLRAAN
jgi:hypothetical protein